MGANSLRYFNDEGFALEVILVESFSWPFGIAVQNWALFSPWWQYSMLVTNTTISLIRQLPVLFIIVSEV